MGSETDMPPLALLAGGLATRLRPLTETIPKSLIEVGGEPFLAHQLRQIRGQGVRKIVICAGYLGAMIRDFAGDGSAFDLAVDYSLDGQKLLGTGGALVKALPKLGREFLVMYGDSYLPTPFRPVAEFFGRSGCLGLMTVFRNQGQWDTSNVVFSDGNILVYDKKNKSPDMAYIDYGLGIFHAGAFAGYPADEFLDLAAVYQSLLSKEQLVGYEVRERFYEIGSPNGIKETSELLAKRKVS